MFYFLLLALALRLLEQSYDFGNYAENLREKIEDIPLADEIAKKHFIFQRHNPPYVHFLLQNELRWV